MEIYISLVLSILLFDHCTLAHGRIKDLLADTQAFRSYLKQLVRIDELKCLLQAEHLRRRQLQRIVRSGSTRVGQMLRLADIQLDVLRLSRSVPMTIPE